MKAVLCKAYGPPDSLVVEEVPSPEPKPGEVIISVKACGVNFPDTLIIQGKYQFKPPMPFSPGGEVAGIVKSVGEQVTHVKPGDAVIAFTSWGGFAEEVAAEAHGVIPMPPGTPFELAASFVMTYGTSYHALKDRANLRPGETLLVLGAAGGVGLAAVELGKAMGATVIAAASRDDKLETCRRHGADHLINYATQDLRARIDEITAEQGVDVVYDPVGGQYSDPALRSLKWKGRFLVVGFAAGEIPKLPLNLPLLKGCAVVGVFWGAFARHEPKANETNLQELVGLLMQGKLRPLVSATYPLERAADALKAISQRKVQGKAVLVTGK